MRAVSAASNRGALPAVVSSIRPAVSGTALPSVGPHSPLSERKSNNPSNRTGRTRGCPMSTAFRLALAGLVRAPGRTATRIVVLAASVALLGGMLLFVGNSLRTVSGSAVRAVPVDLQGPVASYAKATSVATGLAKQPGVLEASAT